MQKTTRERETGRERERIQCFVVAEIVRNRGATFCCDLVTCSSLPVQREAPITNELTIRGEEEMLNTEVNQDILHTLESG